MSELKIAKCKKCPKMVLILQNSPCPTFCCGEPMDVLTANTTDAAVEKHVPQVTVEGDVVKVQVGSVLHPMLEEHSIQWIWLETENGGQMAYLKPGMQPEACFATGGQKPVAVYEYCNLHGLWKKEL